MKNCKIAVVHDWLTTFAGAERVLEQILICFPEADLYSVVDFFDSGQREHIQNKVAKTTFIQKLPFARRKYRNYIFLMPFAIEQLDLSSYDLIISDSHAVAKGVITGPDQVHVCYIHSPMRYIWDLQYQYLRESNLKGLKSFVTRYIFYKMRQWDVRSSNGVDQFVANSKFILSAECGKLIEENLWSYILLWILMLLICPESKKSTTEYKSASGKQINICSSTRSAPAKVVNQS